ncbi:MAG: BatA domain-containing protein [Kiritimatiellia bacterium]
MSFFNPWMLLGLLAIGVPIILHILNRNSARKVEWGAFHFLKDAMTSRRSKVLLEEILLLSTRVLLLGLLALMFARPFVQPGSHVPWMVVLPIVLAAMTSLGVSFAMWQYPVWRRRLTLLSIVCAVLAMSAILFERKLNLSRFGGNSQRDVVIILDGSSSMTLQQGGQSNFENAKAEAENYIKSARRGTAFGLVVGGPVPQVITPAPLSNKRELLNLLNVTHPVQGTMETIPTLTAAAVVLASGNNPAKQIILIGDGQAEGWHADSIERWKVVKRVVDRLPVPPQVIWRTLPVSTSIRNVTVSSITLNRSLVGTDRPVGIDVTISNTGGESVTPDSVQVAIGEKLLSNNRIGQLEPGMSQTIHFSHRFEQSGTQLIRAEVTAGDDMPSDDACYSVVKVSDALKVLIVDGSPDLKQWDRASAFLSLALRPELQTAAKDQKFLMTPEVIAPDELPKQENIGDCAVIILASVKELPEGQRRQLAEYVAQGGGLLLLPDARAEGPIWNAWTYRGESVLPLQLGKPILFTPEGTNRLSLAADTFTADFLKTLRAGTDIGQTEVTRYRLLDTHLGETGVIGRFSNGDPFLALRKLGKGFVALSAMPWDARSSTLTTRTAFVPLVHEVVSALANPAIIALNLAPCEGAVLLLSPGKDRVKAAAGQGGLRGVYYRQAGFRGDVKIQIDPTIDFTWSINPRIKNPKRLEKWMMTYSVRWTGAFKAKEGGTYEFQAEGTSGKNRVRLLLNGVPKKRIYLQKDEYCDLTLEAQKNDPDSPSFHIKLLWRRDSNPFRLATAECLLPVRKNLLSGQPVLEQTIVTPAEGAPFPATFEQTEEGVVLRISQNLTPGLYSVSVPSLFADAVGALLDVDGKIPLCVKSSSAESHLEVMLPGQIDRLRAYVDILTATKPEDVLKTLEGKSFGREVWRLLALAALALLVLEIALTRWIAIRRRTGVQENVEFKDTRGTVSEEAKRRLEEVRGK